MTIANTITALALRTAGITGVGQTPTTADSADAFALLNQMINYWQLQRNVLVIPTTLVAFPDQTTDQPAWTPFEHVLLTTLTVRLRTAYGLPADDIATKMAADAMAVFQANNQQQAAPRHAGVPSTAIQLIFMALRAAGRITDQSSVSDSSADVDMSLSLLSMMVSQWQRKRWLVPGLTEIAWTPAGAQSYLMGPGAPGTTISTVRPDRVETAFVRMSAGSSNPVDYPIAVLDSREDWDRITLKSMPSYPRALFYDPAYPVGVVYLWPIPAAGQCEIHLFVKAALPTFSTVNDALAFPPEYIDALAYNLAVRIQAASAMPTPPGLLALARTSLNTIRLANTQIPALRMPAGLGGIQRGAGVVSGTSSNLFILDVSPLDGSGLLA